VGNLLSIDRGRCAEALLRSVMGNLVSAYGGEWGRLMCRVARADAPKPETKGACEHQGDEEPQCERRDLNRENLKPSCLLRLHFLASNRRGEGRLLEATVGLIGTENTVKVTQVGTCF